MNIKVKISPIAAVCGAKAFARLTRYCGFVMAVCLLLAPVLVGQGITGTITGNVTDPTGASIPGATVTITQVETNFVHTATTSDVGSFTVTQLPPGQYSIQVEATTFKSFREPRVALAIDQVLQVNARMQVGSRGETVEVTTTNPVIQTEESSVGSGRRQPGHPEHAAQRPPER